MEHSPVREAVEGRGAIGVRAADVVFAYRIKPAFEA